MSSPGRGSLLPVGLATLGAVAFSLAVSLGGRPEYLMEAAAPLSAAGASEAGAGRLRAGSVTIHAGPLLASQPQPAESVGGWLRAVGFDISAADNAWPSLDSPVLPGASAWLERSVLFTVDLSGQRLLVRGRGRNIGEALASAGIYLVGRDYSYPGAASLLRPYQTVVVNRVWEEIEIQQETTSYQVQWQPDAELELDQVSVARVGQEGIAIWRYKLTYVNAMQTERRLEDQWVKQEPLDSMMSYGTRVVLLPVDTPAGTLEYWRRVRVLVTSYSPATAGKPASSPQYGITRTGKRAQTGIIAVDPSVIPLGTTMYVPGYGVGVAEDTGGSIKGRHIDVCYDDADLVNWYRWVDVYLLAPAPPEWAIRYVLPNWPRERS